MRLALWCVFNSFAVRCGVRVCVRCVLRAVRVQCVWCALCGACEFTHTLNVPLAHACGHCVCSVGTFSQVELAGTFSVGSEMAEALQDPSFCGPRMHAYYSSTCSIWGAVRAEEQPARRVENARMNGTQRWCINSWKFGAFHVCSGITSQPQR